MLLANSSVRSLSGENKPEAREKLTVCFAGDSGDGIQLLGSKFASISASLGYDFRTLSDFPAEIRAPAGTVYGVSAFQVQFGGKKVMNAGDKADVLFAFNPAALQARISRLKYGGLLVLDKDSFKKKDYQKNDVTESLLTDKNISDYRVLNIGITQQTLAAVKDCPISHKQAIRSRNFWTLGLAVWLFGRTTQDFEKFLAKELKQTNNIKSANLSALHSGYAFGETMELQFEKYVPQLKASQQAGNYQSTDGINAMVKGLLAVAALSQLKIMYCSYPITPASALLHALARLGGRGVMTFQLEDEIAAATMAIGASFAGALGVTATSGPGMSLITEALGLAVASELPLLVIDIQRSGPSTGMPTKTEQGDLNIALFGRHGEAPCVVIAPATVAQCYEFMMIAAKIAIDYMLPVIILADAVLANCIQPWRMPEVEKLQAFEFNSEEKMIKTRFSDTLAPQWIKPGQPDKMRIIGGLEQKSDGSEISYEADNHQNMVALRAEKVKRAQSQLPAATICRGCSSGTVLLIGWGSTIGAIENATTDLITEGYAISHCQIYSILPLPKGLGDIIARFDKIVVIESNSGQLCRIIRSEFLIEALAYNEISGNAMQVEGIKDYIRDFFANL